MKKNEVIGCWDTPNGDIVTMEWDKVMHLVIKVNGRLRAFNIDTEMSDRIMKEYLDAGAIEIK